MSGTSGTSSTSGAELYVYWHCDTHRVIDAMAAAAACQSALCRQRPGLQARLLRRVEDLQGGRTTLMETYAQPGGLDAALRSALLSATAEALSRYADGPRHVEVFAPSPEAPGA